MKLLSALERAKLPMNDLGNARRVFEAARGATGEVTLLWLADGQGGKGCWVAFDGVRWSADEGPARALAFAHKAARAIGDEINALRSATPEELAEVFGPQFSDEMRKDRVAQLWGHAVKAGNQAQSNAMLGQFKALRDEEGEGGAFVAQAWSRDFDAQPLAYHAANGTVRFVELAPGQWGHTFTPGHDPADRFMQVAKVDYDADAVCPHWVARLEVMHRDPEQRVALQRIYGMGLTQLISDQAFYIFQGKGQDGKSVTNDIMVQLHGAYARRSDPKTFLEGPSQASAAHQSDIVRLAGDIRLVVADEPKKGSTWDGQRIKQATGSEMIARGAHATTEVNFTPHWQLIFECNHLPRPPSDDRGFRRRFKLYPWVVQFGVTPGVVDEAVDVVKARLLAEGPGILNWMIEGCCEWLATRVVPQPEAARAATASFWDVSSALGEFIAARCDISDPDASTPASELYEAFRRFCTEVRGDKDDHVMKQTSFGRALNDMQIYAADNNRTKKKERLGIRLKAEGEEAAVEAVVAAGEVDPWLGVADDFDPAGPSL